MTLSSSKKQGSSFPQLIGSRAQVWHGTAYKTTGGLTKHDLMMSHGRVVSRKKHLSAKKEKRLEKAGYFAKKGTFGFVQKNTVKTRGRRKMRGGDEFDDRTENVNSDGNVTGTGTGSDDDVTGTGTGSDGYDGTETGSDGYDGPTGSDGDVTETVSNTNGEMPGGRRRKKGGKKSKKGGKKKRGGKTKRGGNRFAPQSSGQSSTSSTSSGQPSGQPFPHSRR